MTKEKAKNTLTIDDVKYNVDDLDDEQKYCILQVQDLQKKAETLKFSLDQTNVAREVFTAKLKESLENKDK